MEFLLQLITELFSNTSVEEVVVEDKVLEEPVNCAVEIEDSENIFGMLNFH